MLSMSGSNDFVENMMGLKLMPVAVSYEIESCGTKKAYEVYVKQQFGKYAKRPGEDLESIVMGIMQQKGRVHVAFCKPIDAEDLKCCAVLDKNERFRKLAAIVDERILNAYRIWPSNLAAAEMLTGRAPSDPYVSAQFEKYLKEELNTLPKHMVDRHTCAPERALSPFPGRLKIVRKSGPKGPICLYIVGKNDYICRLSNPIGINVKSTKTITTAI